jgi:hypothetical protein
MFVLLGGGVLALFIACGSGGASDGPPAADASGGTDGNAIGSPGGGAAPDAGCAEQVAHLFGCIDAGYSAACIADETDLYCNKYVPYYMTIVNPGYQAAIAPCTSSLLATFPGFGAGACPQDAFNELSDAGVDASVVVRCEVTALAGLAHGPSADNLKARFCAFCPDGRSAVPQACAKVYGTIATTAGTSTSAGGLGLIAVEFSDAVVDRIAEQCTPPTSDAGAADCAEAFAKCAVQVVEDVSLDGGPSLAPPPSCEPSRGDGGN